MTEYLEKVCSCTREMLGKGGRFPVLVRHRKSIKEAKNAIRSAHGEVTEGKRNAGHVLAELTKKNAQNLANSHYVRGICCRPEQCNQSSDCKFPSPKQA